MAPGRADGGSIGPAGRPARAGWADLRLRVLSAIILAPVAVAVVWLGGVFWSVLIILAAAGLACEWVLLCGCRLTTAPGLAVPLAMIAVGVVAAERVAWALPILALTCAAIWAIARTTPSPDSRRPISLAAGAIYIGITCIALIWLRHDGLAGLPNILFLLLVVWASDVGAYLAGRLLGGPRLAPRISPGKTWAGAGGGLLAAVAMGYIVAMCFALSSGGVARLSWRVALVAIVLGVAAQLGDLLESAIKRRFGVKDSGRLIPGHGGLFDRLDGFLTAGPLAALLALALGPGVVLWR